MNQLLVAVKSCHRDRKAGLHEAIRATWGGKLKEHNVLIRFFMGLNPDARDGSPLRPDEIVLDCKDGYEDLPFKTREICKWSVGRLFTHLFLCDCDTVIKSVPDLVNLEYQDVDYAGFFGRGEENLKETFFYEDHTGQYPECSPWASGGYGYFLSRQAMSEIGDEFPRVWAEDMYIGQVIGPYVRQGWMRSRALNMGAVAWHFRKSKKFPIFTAELLHRMYREGGPEKIYKEAVDHDSAK
jgi:hypothetical protein